MTVRATTILSDAWSAWRRDWNILTAVAGVFVFLPRLTLALIVPDYPDLTKAAGLEPSDPAFQQVIATMSDWAEHYGLLVIAGSLATMIGGLVLVALYLAGQRPSVGQALGTSLRLSPRYVLATLIWQIPLNLVALALLPLPFLMLPLFALVIARTLLVGPAILAARPIGAVAAIGRSFRLTRGHMLMLATVALGIVISQVLVGAPFAMFDQWLVAHGPNPVVRVLVDAAAAAVDTLAAIAMALVQVAAWRRLSSR